MSLLSPWGCGGSCICQNYTRLGHEVLNRHYLRRGYRDREVERGVNLCIRRRNCVWNYFQDSRCGYIAKIQLSSSLFTGLLRRYTVYDIIIRQRFNWLKTHFGASDLSPFLSWRLFVPEGFFRKYESSHVANDKSKS